MSDIRYTFDQDDWSDYEVRYFPDTDLLVLFRDYQEIYSIVAESFTFTAPSDINYFIVKVLFDNSILIGKF